jgi:NADH:ubiquinone oxidoreductase subunit 3 (subunit A)
MKTVTLILIIFAAVLAQVLAFFTVTLINRNRARRNKNKEENE